MYFSEHAVMLWCTCREMRRCKSTSSIFSSKIVCWQLVLGLLCVAGLLVVRRQTGWAHEPYSTLQSRSLVEDQHREIRSDTPQKVSAESGRPPVQSPEHSTEQPVVSAPKKYQSNVPEDDIPGHHKHKVWRQSHKQGDLPLMPFDRSPDSNTWDNSVAICACMLQENVTDVREWLIYHRYHLLKWLTCACIPSEVQ